jgi:hypothetical protein
MDVSATNGAAQGQPTWAAPPPPPHGTDAARQGLNGPARRAAGEAATSAVREPRTEGPPPAAARPRDRDQLSVTEIPVPAKEPGATEDERDGSSLKFDVAAADVLARFAIHEETNRVVVTMFQRDTGEVIREIPPREVLDVMVALSGRGLMVDIST